MILGELPIRSNEGGISISEENKALVRRWLNEIFTRGDLHRVDEVFARNYILHDPSFPHEVHGPEGIRSYVAAYRTAFPDASFAVEDQLAQGETVVTRWTARGTHRGEFLGLPATGSRVRVTGIEFDNLRGGKIDEAWVGYHPFAGVPLDPEDFKGAFSAIREAFPDLRMAEADSVREGDKAAFRWVMSGTHEKDFMGIAPTGKRIEAMGMDIVRIAKGEIIEHWGEFDVMGLLRQMGVLTLSE